MRNILALLLTALALAACLPQPVFMTPEPGPPKNWTPTPAPGAEAWQRARALFAHIANVKAEDVQLEEQSYMEWPDACLGVSNPGEMCAEVITPGYIIKLKAGASTITFHSNLDGSSLRIPTAGAGPFSRPATCQQARHPAQKALCEYLQALNQGNYSLAASLYGGDTSILQGWNPDIADDLPAWLERGCTQNGLQCLAPRTLRFAGQDAEGAQQFIVDFNLPNGDIFIQGPCCGAEDGESYSLFLLRVQQVDGKWLVLDLPPYTP